MKKSDELIEEAIQNISSDRMVTKELLSDLMTYIKSSPGAHAEVSLSLSKYVETLQRSNEQVVKLIGIMKKNEKPVGDEDLTPDDINDFYEDAQGAS